MSTPADILKFAAEHARKQAKGFEDRVFWAYGEAWRRACQRAITAHVRALLKAYLKGDCNQEQLGIRLNCSKAQVSQIRSGKRPITIEFGERVIAVLGQKVRGAIGEFDRAEVLVAARMETVQYVATSELEMAPVAEALTREAFEFMREIHLSRQKTLDRPYIVVLLRDVQRRLRVANPTITAANYESVLRKWYMAYDHVHAILEGEVQQ